MSCLINVQTVDKKIPIFTTNISNYDNILKLAAEGVLEEQKKNPVPMDSNVKAFYVSDYSSHILNKKFNPLIDLVLSFCKEISKKYYKVNSEFKCCNCWGMLYKEGDYAIPHHHYPSTLAAIVYIDLEENGTPIIFEEKFTIQPENGLMVVFPAILTHEVPKSKGKRIVVAMNIDYC